MFLYKRFALSVKSGSGGEREVLCTYINIYVLISHANKLSIVGTQVQCYVHIFFPSKRRSALRGANTEAHKNGDH